MRRVREGRSGADPAPSPGRRADAAAVRRAAASIALSIGAIMAVVFVAVGALAIVVLTRADDAERDEHLAHAARGHLEFDHIEDNRVLIAWGKGGHRASLGAPADVAAIDLAALPLGASTVHLGEDRRAHVYVVRRDGGLVAAAVLDTRGGRAVVLSWAPWIAIAVAATLATAGAAWWIARRAVRPLAGALAAQRRFVADASHELRTPLTVVTTRAQLARRHLAQGRDATGDLDRLVVDGRALTDVLDDLLLSAQLGAATRPGERVDVASLVTDTIAGLRPAATARGVTLRLGAPAPAVPPGVVSAGAGEDAGATDPVPVGPEAVSGGDAVVMGIPGALRRAVTALVDNAVSHSPEGGEVQVDVTTGPRQVVVTVGDQGPGFADADRERLTRRFVRGGADGERRHAGLGLSLVREVAEAHHGELELTTSAIGGAEVVLRLPRA